jgi:hypothetical protein
MSLRQRYADTDHAATNLTGDEESQAEQKCHHHYTSIRNRWSAIAGGRYSARQRRAAVLALLVLSAVCVLWSRNSVVRSSSSSSKENSNNSNSNDISEHSRPHNASKRIVVPIDHKVKVSVVVMNHNRPRMIRESQLMKTFTDHPAIDEILLCHSNPKTKFDFQHEKVTNIDAVDDNIKMGLSLRFHYCTTAHNDWVIHVDDDMELSSFAVDALLSEFAANTKRIVGRYGRNYNWTRAPYRNGYDTRTVAGPAEVMLTKIMVMERDMCNSFFRHSHLMQDLLPESKPLWNGEDIFMSLVANHEYGVPLTGPYQNYAIADLDVWEASDKFMDDVSGASDVSGNTDRHTIWKDGPWNWWRAVQKGNKHAAYRGKLWSTAKQRLENETAKVKQMK